MVEEANVRVVEELYLAFGRGDVGAVLGLLAPDSELVFEGAASVPWTGHWRGREGWGRFFQTLGEHTEGVTIQMSLFAAQGDHVVMRGRYQAQVRSTGRRIDSPLVHLWTVRDGMLTRCEEMTNTVAEAEAFGK